MRPLRRVIAGEVHKLVQMEAGLHERVIGQDQAVSAVSNAIRRARSGAMFRARKPVAANT